MDGILSVIAEKRAGGHQTFVALTDGAVAGFATCGPFRAGPGYARTMEHSVMLRPGAGGHSLGRALMTAVEPHARVGGAQSIFAVVSAKNEVRRIFHARLGYAEIVRPAQVGFKWGHWICLVLKQKMLS